VRVEIRGFRVGDFVFVHPRADARAAYSAPHVALSWNRAQELELSAHAALIRRAIPLIPGRTRMRSWDAYRPTLP